MQVNIKVESIDTSHPTPKRKHTIMINGQANLKPFRTALQLGSHKKRIMNKKIKNQAPYIISKTY